MTSSICRLIALIALLGLGTPSLARESSFFQQRAADCGATLKRLGENYRGEEEGKSSQLRNRRVTYIKDPIDRKRNEITIDSRGRLYGADRRLYNSGPNGAILVISKSGKLYASTEKLEGYFHHSTLVAGEDVWFAGTMVVENGRILEVTNHSGHYKAGPREMFLFLLWLRKSKLDVSGLKVLLRGVEKRQFSIRKEFSDEFGIDPRHIYFTQEHGVVMQAHFSSPGQWFF